MSAGSVLDQPLPFTVHNYEFINLIGSGGYSRVYKVHRRTFDFVAKVIVNENDCDEMWKSFDNELSALRLLDHPSVIRVYDYFREGNLFVLVLEYLPGGTLQDEIDRQHGLIYGRLISVCRDMISALVYCHSRSIAHRDLKPQNVLLDKYGRAKLADFGLAMQAEYGSMYSQFRGSFLFTSPEIFRMEPHCPFKSDIWSLGVTFALMAMGRPPFASENQTAVKQAVLTGNLTLRSDLPSEFRDAVSRMIRVDPDERITLEELAKLPVFEKSQRNSTMIERAALGKRMSEPLSLRGRPVSMILVNAEEKPVKRRGIFGAHPQTVRKSMLPNLTFSRQPG